MTALFDTQLDEILNSRPVPSGTGNVEVHTVLCADHLPLYLVAAKSLLLHWPEPQLVVHDDGSLSDDETATLRAHLPGARTIGRREADRSVAALLDPGSPLLTLRAYGPRLLQVVDYFVLARRDRVISMDSDVIVLSEPREVIDWAAADPAAVPALLYSPEGPWTPQGVHWIPEYQAGMPYLPDICCGFAAAYRPAFWDAGLLAVAMGRMPDEILRAGRYISQMCYSLLGGRLSGIAAAQPLGDAYRSGRPDQIGYRPAKVYHYFGSERAGTAANLDGEWESISAILSELAA